MTPAEQAREIVKRHDGNLGFGEWHSDLIGDIAAALQAQQDQIEILREALDTIQGGIGPQGINEEYYKDIGHEHLRGMLAQDVSVARSALARAEELKGKV